MTVGSRETLQATLPAPTPLPGTQLFRPQGLHNSWTLSALPESCVTMSRTPSLSRMRANRTYGLKGGWGTGPDYRTLRP